MRYFSTRRNSPDVSFGEAVIEGQAADGGLFFPSEIPRLSDTFLTKLGDRSNAEIAFEIMRPYVGEEISETDLFAICDAAVDFPFPLVDLTGRISTLELFHGPTLAFKDVGARFMSRCLGHLSGNRSAKTLVVVATSGDTGGAVAAGFDGVEGVDVVILYPKGRISEFQEQQLNAPRSNVVTLEVRGAFDDCQALAKRALGDPDLQRLAPITSANSINIARWLPQQFYYAFALKGWNHEPPVFSVPSGNFGNIAAGLLIRQSGLPIRSFIAACNSNDTVARYASNGCYEPKPSVATLSNAMDVGDPSNFARVVEIVGSDPAGWKDVLAVESVSDQQTADTMREVSEKRGYVLDPHGAVGYRCLENFLANRPEFRGIFLETAHPAKFDSVEDIVGNYDVSPPADPYRQNSSATAEIDADYDQLSEILRGRIGK